METASHRPQGDGGPSTITASYGFYKLGAFFKGIKGSFKRVWGWFTPGLDLIFEACTDISMNVAVVIECKSKPWALNMGPYLGFLANQLYTSSE